jgi:hypothetical protein
MVWCGSAYVVRQCRAPGHLPSVTNDGLLQIAMFDAARKVQHDAENQRAYMRCLQWNGLPCGDAAGTATHKIYPVKCGAGGGKGKTTDANRALSNFGGGARGRQYGLVGFANFPDNSGKIINEFPNPMVLCLIK